MAIRHVGTTFLRSLNHSALQNLEEELMITDERGRRLAVLLPYKTYREILAAAQPERKEEVTE